MTYDYDLDERCRHIVTLLSYAAVGPLSASAIAINLGAGEDDLREPLETLLAAGRIVRCDDGRYASSRAMTPGRVGDAEAGLDHPSQGERARSG